MLERLSRIARPLARFGCAAIGTVYVLIGVLALLALAGVFIEAADEDRLIHVLRNLPGGTIVVWIIIAGAAGYVIWRAIEAWADPYEFGTSWHGLLVRTGIALSAVGYALIAYSAARIAAAPIVQGRGQVAEQERQRLIADVLTWPAGDWLVAAAGLFVLVMGIGQAVLILRRSYAIEINLEDRAPVVRGGIHALAWYGYAARGAILSVLGYFLLRGGFTRDPSAVGDTDTAFDTIGGGLIGDSAFFVVALGTVAYGLFMYSCALFYRFQKRPDTTAPAGVPPAARPSAGPFGMPMSVVDVDPARPPSTRE
jgi:hypothetical protein